MNKTELMGYLDEVGIHPGKQLGQNFLIDNNLLDFIVRQADLKKDELILEVGPGVGALTEHLVKSGAEVIVIEFDYRLKDFLIKRFGDKKFSVISDDACRVDLDELTGGRDFRCIANLPYAISSVFIANLIMMKNPPKEMLFMLQKEMGQRLAASVKTKNYEL
jgi:16S rRNA (adenine1518-N6/adenine1519-N6)-dimethyltransferase